MHHEWRRTGSSFVEMPVRPVDDIVAESELKLYLHSFIVFGTLNPGMSDAGSWMENASFWMRSEFPFPVFRIRYEDMVSDSRTALHDLFSFLGVPDDGATSALREAGRDTKMDGSFFWRQKVDNYKDYLEPRQISLFERYHGDICRDFGYNFVTGRRPVRDIILEKLSVVTKGQLQSKRGEKRP